uniref:Uncharacterized protein n=3 Tax=Corethron hystrix TaxID=216773 RepID=A0A6U5IQA0_9STRA|mmetsp:Transcript_34641/g.80080  ORF Transcript_34641/g.80080 Transcript_34641/m.80080 type:complete len:235 (+) Transcript_34641:1072-1776(+)
MYSRDGIRNNLDGDEISTSTNSTKSARSCQDENVEIQEVFSHNDPGEEFGIQNEEIDKIPKKKSQKKVRFDVSVLDQGENLAENSNFPRRVKFKDYLEEVLEEDQRYKIVTLDSDSNFVTESTLDTTSTQDTSTFTLESEISSNTKGHLFPKGVPKPNVLQENFEPSNNERNQARKKMIQKRRYHQGSESDEEDTIIISNVDHVNGNVKANIGCNKPLFPTQMNVSSNHSGFFT